MALSRGIGLWLPPLLLMAVMFVFSDQPDLKSGLGTLDLVLRKIAHFTEYAALCFLWWRALRTRMDSRRAALVALAIASAYAVTDEYHQTFVRGRHGSPVDWGIDTAGAALTALRVRALEARRRTDA